MLHTTIAVLLIGLQASRDDAGQTEKLTLERALAEALAHNAELNAEKAQMPIVDSRMITARLRPNPIVSVSADHLDLLGAGFSLANAAGPSGFRVALTALRSWPKAGRTEDSRSTE